MYCWYSTNYRGTRILYLIIYYYYYLDLGVWLNIVQSMIKYHFPVQILPYPCISKRKQITTYLQSYL